MSIFRKNGCQLFIFVFISLEIKENEQLIERMC